MRKDSTGCKGGYALLGGIDSSSIASIPLEPLSAQEIAEAVRLLKTTPYSPQRPAPSASCLRAPRKSVVYDWPKTAKIDREADAALFDNGRNTSSGSWFCRRSVFESVGGYGPEDLITGYAGDEHYFDLKLALLDKTNWVDPIMVNYHHTKNVGAMPKGYPKHFGDDYYRVCGDRKVTI